jgi:hypothetical protein
MPPGPGVDIEGRPVVDPTANVIALTEAAVKRLDDLRAAEQRFNEAERRHMQELLEMHAEFTAQLSQAESGRIDAIRAVDVGNVQRAAEVAGAQAEALRNQVAAAAAAAATALSAALDPIQKDIADLRRAQYEAQGQKTQVVEARAGSGAMIAAIGLGITILLALMTVAGAIIATR